MNSPGDILAFLSRPENVHYLARFSRRTYEDKNIVCDREARRDGIFIVTSGRLRAYLSYEGREFTLLFLNPGDVFSTHSEATIEAKQHSEILMTDLQGFEDILLHFPHLSILAISILGRVLSNSTHIIEDLMFRDVRGRLLRFLVQLIEEKGRVGQRGIEVPLDLNTEEIAMLIGSTRQSTSSMFNELIKEGYLSRISRTLVQVNDLEALKRLRDEPRRRLPI
jgi:CRP-like cAMP-binding protein